MRDMARVFNRGELKLALLSVIDSLGEGHGYAIMQELQRRVGSQWRPSPGAIYPALIALEESGALTSIDRDRLRVYRLTGDGEALLDAGEATPLWHDVSRRADARRPRVTLGRLLDRFELGLPRRATLTPEQAESIDAALTRTRVDITTIIDRGDRHG
jgi:DNA-binding PadR family transcriptional regulator